MSRPKIYFRADGNSLIGLGHVVRSLALAEMLSDEFECHFFIQSPSSYLIHQIKQVCQSLIELPKRDDVIQEAIFMTSTYLTKKDIVVLDGYKFKTDYQIKIKESGCKLVCIDDIHSYHFVADVVINHAPGIDKSVYSVNENTKLLLGLNYCLLRRPFLEAAKKKRDFNKMENVFICFGGSDTNNLTLRTIEAVHRLNIFKNIYVLIGGANTFKRNIYDYIAKGIKQYIKVFENISAKQIVSIMSLSHCAIVPCSSILYETLCIKMPIISGYYVDNQINVYHGFNNLGLIKGIGDFNEFNNYEEVINSFNRNNIKNYLELQNKHGVGRLVNNISRILYE